MAYNIVRPKDRDEWLIERKKGIGSSDAGTIMGVSPFNTPHGLWLQKTGREEGFKESDAMFNGHILEPAVAEWFEKKTGNIVDRTSEGDWLAVDKDRPYLRVSPDRIYYTKDTLPEEQVYENGRVLEIKSTSKIVDEENIPAYWFCQVQYQMGILGLKHATIAWITGNPTLQFGCTDIEFNPAFFEHLIGQIEKFWLENVQKDIEPEAINEDDADKMYKFAEASSVAYADKVTMLNCLELKELRKQIQELEKRKDELTESIKLAMKENETLVYKDEEDEEQKERVIATWKNSNVSKFNEEAFMDENPDIAMEYMEEKVQLDVDMVKKNHPELYKNYVQKVTGARRLTVK